MGFRNKDKQERKDFEAPLDDQWEYMARNLAKVSGPLLESDFNKLGRSGWEFVAMASGGKEGYAIFKRPRSLRENASHELETAAALD
jgi:hypothetical protein